MMRLWSCDIIVQNDETGLVTLLYKVMRLWSCDIIVQSDWTGLNNMTLLYKVIRSIKKSFSVFKSGVRPALW